MNRAHNGSLPFLTDDFNRVLPIIKVSLVATAVVNLVYMVYDPGWFKSLSQIGLLSISLARAAVMYWVFPFDSSALAFDWATLTRVVLILAMVGITVGIMVLVVKPVRGSPHLPKGNRRFIPAD